MQPLGPRPPCRPVASCVPCTLTDWLTTSHSHRHCNNCTSLLLLQNNKHCSFGITDKYTVVKVVTWRRGLTWQSQVGANPIPIPHPTILALFGHKITLYRLNHGGSYCCRGLKSKQGAELLCPLTSTTANILIEFDQAISPELIVTESMCQVLVNVWY